MSSLSFAEYIWLDGGQPVQGIRSKTRVVRVPESPDLNDFPAWSFDGSSTEQAAGEDSDCLLEPVCVVNDPLRGTGSYLVLCEVQNADGSAHISNRRATLRAVLSAIAAETDPWVGFEQEYTLYREGRPLGFPANGFPGPQGPYYCGAGVDRAFGREIVEAHARACLEAGLRIYGLNAEVMPGQWEFQVGYRGLDDETGSALVISDHVWIARWLLHRIGERHGVEVSFDNKPVKGDWNGAGMHTNFSTANTRDPNGGRSSIEAAIERLALRHHEHIRHYGDKLDERLTGLHETCDINTFRWGVAHRGASIRIPQPVAIKGHGYLEDRRPGANADPYVVAASLVATVCDVTEIFDTKHELAVAA
ncbi:glutamine synthetase beta-grasp domain-containing protein [Pelagibius sp.]|uniref:glutamine synthetase beta-grasp domain-containing protein n=1 Tax=Pelagibius sp. TaxID=1931238 RepID=UPI00262D6825|nr:glutamine synthetase beta-grasp domain-containing protein [Pelagibius sp.]